VSRQYYKPPPIPGPYPALRPIKGGWAAFGPGWAVHGSTQEDALRHYAEALQLHERIAARTGIRPFPLDSDDPLIGVDFPAPGTGGP
jgi:hypothetical protein